MEELDRRINAYRPDLADARLESKVTAERFVDGKIMRIATASAPLLQKPSAGSAQDSEALFGEAVRMFDERDGWAWIQLLRDGYVGYVPTAALAPDTGKEPTHRVIAPATLAFAREDIKSTARHTLPLNSLIDVLPEPQVAGTLLPDSDKLSQLIDGSYIVRKHIAPTTEYRSDFVEVAEAFVGSPYMWGGCTRNGIDCSGLVQMALLAAGSACPRDSDQQREELGMDVTEQVAVSAAKFEGLRRGDLMFWAGHVGILIDGERMLHANAYHMATTIERVTEAVARIEKSGGKLTAVKRLDPSSHG